MVIELLRPFAYLTIRHKGNLPFLINWGLPVVVSVVMAGVLSHIGFAVNVYGDTGLIAKLLSFVQSLPGFFIAALAVIATLNNSDMLKVMPGEPPTMLIVYNGGLERTKLTRRRFLSSMFAYLTAQSLVLTVGAVLVLAVAESLKNLIAPSLVGAISFVGLWAYLMLFCQMITVTMWGLFYLGERVHTPDA